MRPLLLLTLLLVACAPPPLPPPPPTPTMPDPAPVVGVTRSAMPGFADLSPAFGQMSGAVPPRFVSANDATLWAELESGQVDAIVTHTIPPGAANWFNPVALDGLIFIVHPDNPVTSLTPGKVQALYAGSIADWLAAGGSETAVIPIGREPGSGARALFRERVMADRRVTINARLVADPEAVRAAVAAEPGAIGYLMLGNDRTGVKTISLDGLEPTPATLADQSYPLTSPLYFVMPGAAEPGGHLRAWLAWLQGDEGQGLLGARYGRVR